MANAETSGALITAAICTYSRYDLLDKAIRSTFEQSLPKSCYRIIVVDNSPDAAQAQEARAAYQGVEGLSYVIERTPGLSNARNVALNLCDSPYICYLDDDAIAGRVWLEKLIEAFESQPGQVGVVGGKINPIWGAPRPAWLPNSLLGSITVVDWGGPLRELASNEWVAGANIAFSTADLRTIGGFPTSLGRIGSGTVLLSNEEINILREMKSRGRKLMYAPEAAVDHLVDVRRLQQAWFRKRYAWQAVSEFIGRTEGHDAESEQAWRQVLDYFGTQPPRRRTVRGLFDHCDDAAEFERQIGAIYSYTTALLSGMDLKFGD